MTQTNIILAVIGGICLLLILVGLAVGAYYLYRGSNNTVTNSANSTSNTNQTISIARASTLATCPTGYNNSNASCVKPAVSYPNPSIAATCPTGFTNDGTNCVQPAAKNSAPSILATCPSGYTNNGVACVDNSVSYSKQCSITGGNQYPCNAGYEDIGCYCQKSGAIGTVPLSQATCPARYILNGSRCYPICAAGFTNQGEYCVRPALTKDSTSMSCPTGYFRQGSRCMKTCPTGFTNSGETCVMPQQSLGLSSMNCPSTYPTQIGAECYGACPQGYTASGTTCTQ